MSKQNRHTGRRKDDKRNSWSFFILATLIGIVILGLALGISQKWDINFNTNNNLEIIEDLKIGDTYSILREKFPGLDVIIRNEEKIGELNKNGVVYTLYFTDKHDNEKVWRVIYKNYLYRMDNIKLETYLSKTYGLPVYVDCGSKETCEYRFHLPYTIVVVRTQRYNNDVLLYITATDAYYESKKQ